MNGLIKTFFNFYFRNKVIALLALLGLSLGLFGIFTLSLKLINEMSYNKNIENGELLYRVISRYESGFKQPAAPYPLFEMALKQSPHFSVYSRFVKLPNIIGQMYGMIDDVGIIEEEVYAADSNFMELLNFKNLFGSEALKLMPGNILLSKSKAYKYFGTSDIIGKVFTMKLKDKRHNFIVSGVFEDIAWNNTYRPGFVCDLSFHQAILVYEYGYDRDNLLNSLSDDNVCFLLKKEQNISEREFVTTFSRLTKNAYENTRPENSLLLQRFEDIFHYSANVKNDFIEKGDILSLKYYRVSILVLLLLTAFNYILLQTNLTAKRHLEIGIRKVFGASHISLAKQLFVEALMLAVFTAPFIVLYYFLYQNFLDGYLLPQVIVHTNKLWEYFIWLGILLFVIIAISTVYLSVYVSALKPIEAIHRKSKQQVGRKFGIYVIVGLQFFVSLVLLTFSINIYRQLNYGLSVHSTHKTANILNIYFDSNISRNDYNTLKSNLLNYGMVKAVTGGILLPPSNASAQKDLKPDNDRTKSVVCEIYRVNNDFFETYGLYVDGDSLYLSDGMALAHGLFINSKAADAFGFANPLEERIAGLPVLGVVEDFRFHSLHKEISPMVFYPNEMESRQMAIRFYHEVSHEKTKAVQDIISKALPDKLFTSNTFNEALDSLYEKDIGLRNFILFFTIIISIIALIGLTGISLYYLNENQYSISVKRVYGAPDAVIIKDFSKYFVLMIAIAIVISIPFSGELTSRFSEMFDQALPYSYLILFVISVSMLVFIVLICYFVLSKTLNTSPMKYLTGNK
ncbi:MAG: ABC transporter permease [Bacteroidales bacterium]|jgi:putative ABC transport system permease protein|nr:ABC transporter permease [Bacteroidales bacterium]